MRVAVVDIGTNSTRLLVADVRGDGSIEEFDRHTRVTRLGDGVDRRGVLAKAAIERVCAALDDYAVLIAECGAQARPAVLTSAVRDAANGRRVRRRGGGPLRTRGPGHRRLGGGRSSRSSAR